MFSGIKIFTRKIYLGLVESLLLKKSFFVRKKTMLILRIDAIGDYVLFRNFISHLKESKRFKGYRITFCGNSNLKELAKKFDSGVIDEFIWINNDKFLKTSNWRNAASTLLKMHFRGYEVLIHPNDVHSRINEHILKRSGVRNIISEKENIKIKFEENGTENNDIVNGVSKFKNNTLFQFYRNKMFIESITGEKTGLQKPFFILNNAEKKDHIVVFPGAGDVRRRWSAEKYAELCLKIRETSDSRIIICGNSSDKLSAEKIICGSGINNIEDKTAKTSLSELVELISAAKLVISNESCAVHIAAAVDTPAICISNGNHFGRFNPYPESVAPFIKTIYPREITNEFNNYSGLVKKYFIYSEVNIDSITSEEVFRKVYDNLKHRNEDNRKTGSKKVKYEGSQEM